MKIHLQACAPNTGNHATDECKRNIFAKYPNAEEASGEIKTEMNG